MASKLHLIPRYRQRVRTVPFELGRPVWVDDPDFDLGYHLRHTALPAPGDDAAFCRLMGRLMSQPLDRERPLWEAWLVEGLEGGRWALVFKVHHCMVDGIAGVELLTVLLDLRGRLGPIGDAEPWVPRAEPPGALKVARCVGRAGGRPSSRPLGASQRSVAHPIGRGPHRPLRPSREHFRFLPRLAPTRPLSIEGSHRSPPGLGPLVGRAWRR